MKEGLSRTVGACLALGMVTLWLTSPANALPPANLNGIDLPMVLAFDDHARLAKHQLTPIQAEEASLEHVRTIVLDPGHGGENSGAQGVAGIKEKYLTLELAYQLRDRIHEEYPGVRVLLTRYWDRELSLGDRVHFANTVEADLFLSLHYNAAVHNRAVGFETYFLEPREATPGQQTVEGAPVAAASGMTTGISPDDHTPREGVYNDAMAIMQRDLERARQHRESGLLAEIVNASLDAHLDSVNRGVKQADFGVLRGALMPAVVVEAGFLTHEKEGRRVFQQDHRRAVVEALFGSVEAFDQRLADRDSDD